MERAHWEHIWASLGTLAQELAVRPSRAYHANAFVDARHVHHDERVVWVCLLVVFDTHFQNKYHVIYDSLDCPVHFRKFVWYIAFGAGIADAFGLACLLLLLLDCVER